MPEHGTPNFKDSKQYIKAKVKILSRDFKIVPTFEEMNHLHELKNVHEIDRFTQKIILNHWEEE